MAVERLLWVSLPYATAGVIFVNGRVAETAPIFSWMVGKSQAEVLKWLDRKHARYRWLS